MTQDPDAIRELADLESDVSTSFRDVIRRKIYRRTTVSQFANLYWKMPGIIFMEFLSLIMHLLAVADGGKGKSR
jgi:hypothetical protein